MKTTYYERIEDLPKLGKCPVCGAQLERVWGNGFDYDLAQCPEKHCDYFHELQEDTGFEFGTHGRIYNTIFEKEDFE